MSNCFLIGYNPSMSSKTSTNKITAEVIDYLLRLPECFAYRSNTIGVPSSNGSFRSAPKRGIPDITGVYKSKSFYIEVKTGSDCLSEVQKSFIASVQAAGGMIIVIDSFASFLGQFWGKFNRS